MAFQRGLRLIREAQHAIGVGEEHLSFGGEHEAPALPVEELRADAVLELLDARRHVGLHAVQRGGGLGDASLLGDRLEDVQLDQIHVLLIRTMSS